MIKVGVLGAAGRVGSAVVEGVKKADDLELRRDGLGFRCFRLALIGDVDRLPQQVFKVMAVHGIRNDDLPGPQRPSVTVKGHGGGRNVGDLCRGPHDLRKAIVAIGEQPRL